MKKLSGTRLPLAICLLAVASFALAGCTSASTASPAASTTSSTSQATTPQGVQLYTPVYKPNGKEVAVMKTNKGTITVELFGKDAPIAVGSFVELARKGFFNNLKFHRLDPGFVVQGGDPLTRNLTSAQVQQKIAEQSARGPQEGDLGTGGPGYALKGEFTSNPHLHLDGTFAAARSQSPDSAGSQFYFCLGEQTFLDGKYTVFGQTTKGFDVVHKLGVGDVIESVTIENASK